MSVSQTDARPISRRYATAIFAEAVKAGKETVVTEEIETLAAAVAGDDALRQALSNPLVTVQQQAAIFDALVKSGDDLTRRSVAVLAEGGRAELIATLAAELRARLTAHRGEEIATVTSAQPLADAVTARLRAALAKATGKKVDIHWQQDPSILGGLIVQIGSQRLDASLAGALTHLRAELAAAPTA